MIAGCFVNREVLVAGDSLVKLVASLEDEARTEVFILVLKMGYVSGLISLIARRCEEEGEVTGNEEDYLRIEWKHELQ